MDCIFCRIISGEIPARMLGESAHSVSFLDAFPLARGHVLVIPKSHRAKIQDLDAKENADLFGLVHTMISGVDLVAGSTLMAVHNGPGAGQEVPHVHVHLVPRSGDDHAGPIHSMFDGVVKLSESETDDVCKLVGKQPLL
ncbi:MAG: HIT domain-containing protein [Nitrosopumilus sp. H8]|nr:MAG: HIT domain-containing protein [Nitrosopumilus sp. H13]RNJ78285.1 MAG: HIT domain-containing protein [Nitrosopumilus sp. H8]